MTTPLAYGHISHGVVTIWIPGGCECGRCHRITYCLVMRMGRTTGCIGCCEVTE